jgi:hypothetical protein
MVMLFLKKSIITKQLESTMLLTGELNELKGKQGLLNLFGKVDISSLVYVRILYGAILLWEVSRYFKYDWIARYWIEPTNHFTYFPFDFLSPLPGNGMYILFAFLGVLAACIMLGLFYRVSMTLFFLLFTYTFLLEQARYMNHFYLVCIFSFIMIFIPCHRSFSLDAKRNKNLRSEITPLWSLWLVRFMIGMPYFFGGVAKLNGDWFKGEPLRSWLDNDSSIFLIGNYLEEEWMIMGLSYGGVLLDLFVVPALLFRKTRIYGFLAILIFHVTNSQIFTIGMFPWFMIATTAIFFNPGWVRKFYNNFKVRNPWVLEYDKKKVQIPMTLDKNQKQILWAIGIWVFLMCTIPLRHFFIPSNASWTEEGHRFAWHMKLRTKKVKGHFILVDKETNSSAKIDMSEYLENWQIRKMMKRPYMIWQFAQMVDQKYQSLGKDVEVYADIRAGLNGRPKQQFIDPTIDLTKEKRPLFPGAKWIVPLNTPLEI